MKTAAVLFIALLGGQAMPSLVVAAPAGTSTSQSLTYNVTIDSFAYAVSSLATYTRTSQGIQVSTGQANIFSTQQPAGPQNNSLFQDVFTIPASVLDLYY